MKNTALVPILNLCSLATLTNSPRNAVWHAIPIHIYGASFIVTQTCLCRSSCKSRSSESVRSVYLQRSRVVLSGWRVFIHVHCCVPGRCNVRCRQGLDAVCMCSDVLSNTTYLGGIVNSRADNILFIIL